MASASSPEECLSGYISVNFSDEIFTFRNTSTWLGFWSSSIYTNGIQEIHKEIAAETIDLLTPCLMRLGMNEQDSQEAADILTAFVDGLWLRRAIDARSGVNPDRWTPENCRRLVKAHVERQFGINLPTIETT